MVNELTTKKDFDAEVIGLEGDSLVVIDFYATWCGPCKVISPQVEKFEKEFASKGVKFYKVDVDEATDIAQELNIRAMPTFKLFKNGEEVTTIVGANGHALHHAIQQHA